MLGATVGFGRRYKLEWASQVALVVKNSPANAGDIWDTGSIPESGRSLEGGMTTHSSILAWRIPMDRGPWKATIHMVTKSQTWLKRVRMHTQSGVRPDQWLSGLQTACKRGTQYFFLEILEGFNVNFSECSGLLRIAFTNSLGVLSSVLCGL